MPLSIKKYRSVLFALAFAVCLSMPIYAGPVLVGPPPVVDGKPLPMPTVKKWGQYWYPASLVGYMRGIEFAYDAATNTLYADGSKLEMDTIVIEGRVYVPLQPVVTQAGLRPGLEALQLRRSKYEAMRRNDPEAQGNMDALFMETEVDMPDHPWAEGASFTPTGQIIDLDATGTGALPAHMQSMPVNSGAIAPLPGKLPPPSFDSQYDSPQSSPSARASGIPLHITTAGGPQVASEPALPTTSATPTGMQPIPVAPLETKETSVVPANASRDLAPASGKNQVFEVSVKSAKVQAGSLDGVLLVRLSQKNLSPVAQANLGSFALRLKDGRRLDPVRSRSVMPDGTLAPGGVREGELVFQMPQGALPGTLELEGTLPLSVGLSL